MNNASIKWYLRRKDLMPIVEAKGDFLIAGIAPDIVQCVLIQSAIELIDKASNFKGRPYPNKPCIPTTNTFSVSLSLVFPSEADLYNFVNFLMNNK